MKKTIRKILSIVLAVVMLFSFTTVAYAVDGVAPCAGTETLYIGEGTLGSFTLSGTNLTPVKTMGDAGKLWIYGVAKSNNGGNPWWLTVQIIDFKTGDVIAETTSTPRTASEQAYAIDLDVTVGQKIQIFMFYGKEPKIDAFITICYQLS